MKKTLLALVLLIASVRPVAAQTQRVVQTPSTTASTVLQNAATGNGNGTALDASGYSQVIVTINCTVACDGVTTVNFEGSADNSNWVALPGTEISGYSAFSATPSQSAIALPVSTVQTWEVPLYGLRYLRARISDYSAGTLTVTAYASMAASTRHVGVTGGTVGVSGSVSLGAGTPSFDTLQSAATANGNGTALALAGYAAATLTVNCSGCSGGTTVNFEVSGDGGSNYTAIQATQIASTPAFASSTTTAGVTVWRLPAAGFSHVRARISAYSAGTVTVTGRAYPVGDAPYASVVTANAGTGTFTVGDGSGALTVDGTVSVSGVSTETTLSALNVKFPSAAALADNTSNPTTTSLGMFAHIFDGSTWDRWTGAVSQSGAWTVQPGNTANTTPWLFTIQESGTPATVRNLAANDALNVAIVDSSGNQITSFGGSGGTAQNDNTAVAQITGGGALYDTTPPAITDGNVGLFRMNSSRQLQVDCVAGCSGSSFADNSAFTFGTTAIGLSGGVLDDTSTNAATENAAALARISANRNWYMQIRDGAGNERGANVTAGNALVVDGSAVTQPVSGTVTANAGTGTFAISAASLPLPTGASTLAEQQTQTTALQVIDNLPNTLGSTTSGQSGALALGAVTTAAPSYTNAQSNALSLTTAGALRTDGSATTQPVSGSVTANAGTNLNTSALALESGGNLATVAGAVRAEDVASADAHTGIPALAVRKATPANTSGTDGDYENLQMSAGRLWVDASGKTLTVDGSGVTQPVSGTVTVGTFPDNEPINVAQMNGVAVSMGNGASGTGVQRVTIANDSTGQVTLAAGSNTIGALTANQSVNVAQINGVTPLMGAGNTGTGSHRVTLATDQAALVGLGIYAEDAPEAAGGNLAMSGSVRRDTPATSAGASGDNATINTNASGAVWVSQVDPCSSEAKTTDPISITADTVIIAATSGKKNYICSLVIVAGAAEIASITEGTGSTCGTSEAALAGSTTDANGLSFAANGGVSAIGGNATIIAGKTANVDTCLNVSGSNRVSGWVTWVQR